ncbi:calcineurin-like phosphoesterase [Pseudomassariella vexata]|uniref:Calcineurin-like phosphoesterase n=1 Tax=Pseudomassariella vexata TaxID=1141098 RepID=A0A1Y2E1T3_9PEZI|nr:calcineurin-like phosphoesterase [Pseudomassariella vexata]ORY65500.1 calcineurin-like phosphoesterase [Pseudomassariella vexata]
MGLLTKLGLRRRMIWDTPTLLDEVLDSPFQALVLRIYLIILWLRGNPVKPPKNGRPPIKIVFLSDTHDEIVQNVPEGDVLIHAGDLTNEGRAADIQRQINWLASLPHQYKVVVCGNHDSWFDRNSRREEDVLGNQRVRLKDSGVHYLARKAVTLNFHGGRRLVIYGAPDVPKCGGASFAFQYVRQEHPWANLIPNDTDVLVTHGPPRHHLDLGLGCSGLLNEIWRVRPKVHVFGHVHSARGMQPVFWDDCQKSYESVMSRKKQGLIRDVLPNRGWIDAVKVLVYGLIAIMWDYIMLGGGSSGSIMINAGCQKGTTGRLTTEKPFTIEI